MTSEQIRKWNELVVLAKQTSNSHIVANRDCIIAMDELFGQLIIDLSVIKNYMHSTEIAMKQAITLVTDVVVTKGTEGT